jgi:oligopeptide transport system ATP-binding protein
MKINKQKIIMDVKNLSVQFNTPHGLLKAVNDISFELKEGETLGILGESGSGKSVTVNAIMGLLEMPPAEITGNIYFDSINLIKASPKKMQTLRGKRISLIHQDPVASLNPLLTVGYQICEMLKVHQPGLSQSDAKKKAIELMEKVKIPSAKERIKSYPFELSGGMCQRILIALAISLEPDILIADEPTTALDVTVQRQIMDLLYELKKYSNMSMILITHDIALVAENTTETLVMYAGKIF